MFRHSAGTRHLQEHPNVFGSGRPEIFNCLCGTMVQDEVWSEEVNGLPTKAVDLRQHCWNPLVRAVVTEDNEGH